MSKLFRSKFSSLILLCLITTQISPMAQAPGAQATNLPEQKAVAEVKKIKAERTKILLDIATNKMFLTALGIALITCGPLGSKLGKYIGTKYGQISAHSKEIEKWFSRCYNAQLNRTDNITAAEAMALCEDGTITLAELATLEAAHSQHTEQHKLIDPINAYWGLSLKEKMKHFGYKMLSSGIDATAKKAAENLPFGPLGIIKKIFTRSAPKAA